jgi:hypothetical protein
MTDALEKILAVTAADLGVTMERREVIDLFGETVVIEISESKAVRKPTRPNGYAAPPGTGPTGETCKSCEHAVRTSGSTAGTYRKCLLMKAHWTGGPGSDILFRSPACRKWERENP